MATFNNSWWDGLTSSKKSMRLHSIEQALIHGKNQEGLERLLTHRQFEPDEECLAFLDSAISTLQNMLGRPSDGVESFSLNVETVAGIFEKSPSTARMDILMKLRQIPLQPFSIIATEWLKNEKNSTVAATIIKTFSEVWPEEKQDLLISQISSKSLVVRLSAIEAMVKLAPAKLFKELPDFLCSDEPRIRSLAIEALEKLDLEEALKHLEDLLLGNDYSRKEAVIPHLFMLRFGDIRKIALKFLIVEKNLDLISTVGILFQMNPDPEIPLALWEISEISPKPKAEVIKEILSGALAVIKQTNLLTEDFDHYYARLKEAVQKRMAVRFVKECISRLSVEDTFIEDEITSLMEKQLSHPLIRAAFEEALSWPISDRIKDFFKKNLFPGSSRKIEPEGAKEEFVLERIRQIANFVRTEFDIAYPIIRDVLSDPNSSRDLVAVSLRTAKKICPPEKKECFVSQIGNVQGFLEKDDPNLISASMEFLAFFSPETITPMLATFLKSPMKRVQGAAIEILVGIDTNKALSALFQMLQETPANHRKSIVAFFIYFDFSLIRERLTEFICKNPEKEFFETSLFLYQTNPDVENLYFLYKFEHVMPKALQELAKKARMSVVTFLVDQKMITTEGLKVSDEKFRLRLEKEQMVQSAALTPYSLKKIKEREKENEEEPKNFSGYVRSLFQPYLTRVSEYVSVGELPPELGIFLAGVLGMTFFWFFFLRVDETVEKTTESRKSSSDIKVVGSVLNVEKKSLKVLIKAKDGKTYLFELLPNEIASLTVGDNVEATLVPFRLDVSGIYISKEKTFRKK
ncbi:MAG: HEAT repeat domain-containing protein [Candidatus Riflebacteria bacterium]|nr:HEAT repeat domain-containing protein [Candidatus Riflebacteria bacterium]